MMASASGKPPYLEIIERKLDFAEAHVSGNRMQTELSFPGDARTKRAYIIDRLEEQDALGASVYQDALNKIDFSFGEQAANVVDGLFHEGRTEAAKTYLNSFRRQVTA